MPKYDLNREMIAACERDRARLVADESKDDLGAYAWVTPFAASLRELNSSLARSRARDVEQRRWLVETLTREGRPDWLIAMVLDRWQYIPPYDLAATRVQATRSRNVPRERDRGGTGIGRWLVIVQWVTGVSTLYFVLAAIALSPIARASSSTWVAFVLVLALIVLLVRRDVLPRLPRRGR